jgi:hypothetical protein
MREATVIFQSMDPAVMAGPVAGNLAQCLKIKETRRRVDGRRRTSDVEGRKR